jgi:peptidyl-prolyl cis-trans isomerase SurA
MRLFSLFSIVVLFLSLALQTNAKAAAEAEVADRIVAVVNKDVITLSEVNDEGAPYFQALIKQAPTDQLQGEMRKLRQEILSHLIDQLLIEQEAARLEIKISDEEVNQTIDSMLADNHVSKEEFRKDLAAKGLTEELYRSKIKGQMLQSRLINREIRSKVVVTDAKINQYYKENYASQPGTSGYHLQQMGFLWGDQYKRKTAAEAKQAAEAAKKELDDGKAFAEVAAARSDLPSKEDGGDIGVIQKDELASAMKEVVQKLKPGETSNIVETQNGYQILKLVSVQDGDQANNAPPLPGVKKEIEAKLFKEEGEQLMKKWLTELRAKAFIKENL